MPFNFPTTGLVANVTTYSYSGRTWIWNGSAWNSVGTVQGTQGTTGAQGIQGLQGTQGLTGSFGGAALDYKFSTNTTSTPPLPGYVKFNNADITLATEIYIHYSDDNSASAYSFLQTIDDSTSAIKGHFSVTSQDNPDLFGPVLFAITGSHTEDSVNEFFVVPISHIAGANPSIANDYHIILTFARTGDKGDTGIQGLQGLQGIQGVQGTQGLQGTEGFQGVQGLQGIQGIQGVQGTQGLQGIQGAAAPLVVVNTTAKTSAYSLTASDYNTIVQMNASAAFTVDTSLSAAPTGTQITLVALTTGVSVTGSGVTLYYTPGNKLRTTYSAATLICLSSNVWLLTGDLTA